MELLAVIFLTTCGNNPINKNTLRITVLFLPCAIPTHMLYCNCGPAVLLWHS